MTLICPNCHHEFVPSVPPVTKKQLEIVRYVESYMRANQVSPTMAEIAVHVRVSSSSTIAEHINNLERKGILRRAAGVARGLVLIVRSDEIGELPPPRSEPDATGDEDLEDTEESP